MRKLYLGLLHYPVYNKNQEIITSAITNFDIHDISRASKTFGVEKYFIITPENGQKSVMGKIIEHWQKGFGATYNKDRKTALEITSIINTLDDAIETIKNDTGLNPIVTATSAQKDENYTAYTIKEMRSLLEEDGDPIFLLFGTGYGMVMKNIPQIKNLLEPIYGTGDYNHLSVRSAVSIYLHSLKGL